MTAKGGEVPAIAKILHITAHMGGGVGRTLSSITSYANNTDRKNRHKILIVERPEKKQFIDICRANNVDVEYADGPEQAEREIADSDIIQISWWHHPRMAEFICSFPKIPVRMVLWSHVSGCSYPELPFSFAAEFHKVFFATEYTRDNPYWSPEQRNMISGKSEIVYGAGDLRSFSVNRPVPHEGFIVGYVGTLNYSKLNPDFAYLASLVKIPGVRFALIGDAGNKQQIIADAMKYGIEDKLDFRGYVNDVGSELSNFDVFGYPLNPWHFGATENAILEAMAAGVPVVAFNQAAERYLIKHMETGLLAEDYEHYVQLVQYLHDNPDERRRLGRNAREFVLKEFDIGKTVRKMNDTYEQVMSMDRKIFDFTKIFGNKPYEWFLACLGADRKVFADSINGSSDADIDKQRIEKEISNCRYILKEDSKSSVLHFARVFPRDGHLAYWKRLIGNQGQNAIG